MYNFVQALQPMLAEVHFQREETCVRLMGDLEHAWFEGQPASWSPVIDLLNAACDSSWLLEDVATGETQVAGVWVTLMDHTVTDEERTFWMQ